MRFICGAWDLPAGVVGRTPSGGCYSRAVTPSVRAAWAAIAIVATGSSASAWTASAADAAAIPWQKDFKTALREARASGKPVLVDFWAQWCEWCHELDATTYRDARVIELARDFLPVKVDTEGTLAERELAAQYGVEILPTIAFLSPRGRLFVRHATFEGPETFPATLESARRLAGEVSAWEEALARDRDDAAALAGLGLLLAEQTLFAESRDLLRRASRADRSRPAAERKRTRHALALAERRAGKRGEAERMLEEALAITPADPAEDAAVLFALGEGYLERGRTEQARAAWTRALDLAPDGPVAGRATKALAALPAR